MSDIDISSHARLRWLERIRAEEPYPGGAIRGAYKRGREFALGALDAVVDDRTGAVLVCDDGQRRTVVITVLTEQAAWGQ